VYEAEGEIPTGALGMEMIGGMRETKHEVVRWEVDGATTVGTDGE